jgi:hypothetical protein
MNRTAAALGLLLLPSLLHAIEPAPKKSASPPDRKLETKFEGIFSKFLRRKLTIEKVRWRIFPVRFTGTHITLWEDSKLVMAEGPVATLTISPKTLTSWRLRVSEMTFKDAKATLRFDHDGRTNVTSMIKDLGDYARANYRHGQRQKVVYGVFRVENGTVDVVDRETGVKPFGAPFRVDARGDIHGVGPRTQFPFHLKAVLLSSATPTPMQIIANGRVRNEPQVHVIATDVPSSMLIPYLPVVRWFKGVMSAELDFSKAGAYTFWKLRFVTDAIKADIPLPFPAVKVEGFFHPYVPSHLNVLLLGEPTRVDVKINIHSFRSKKVTLSVQSRGADIDECIRWCETGYWLNQAPINTMNLPPQSRWPPVWKITGKADIDATLASVMGPRLAQESNGLLKFKIENGRLSGMPGLIKTFALLNLSSMLGDINKPPNGLVFKTVGGEVNIQDGVAKTNGLILLESPNINLGVMGQIDFVQQTIDAKMLLGVANMTEAVIAHIPFVRRFKSNEKKGVIPIWMAVQGPLHNPTIKLLPLATFDRGMWKALPPPFQVPEKILKSIYDHGK